MNANELAEKIQFDVEPYIETDQFIFDECANMLRQQQTEIEALKYEKSSGVYDLAKTLTDEEILNVAFCCEVHTVSIENDWDGTVIDFARAILRKAQEK